ncbi:hypothetical protein SLEP1_g58113 [Rubroshorea leprosula]|uniref:Pentatricopeptide repeat-containing protein n=1 Tax=Rubroshorea leprosula TaxID=152421 RepID=A0AAV5MSA8_9ROSI|nr:hypothetical protein SLEP1_g58113 [Rubroshorea leprosula]
MPPMRLSFRSLLSQRSFRLLMQFFAKMTYDACKIREGIFLNLMKHFSQLSLHEKLLEMLYAIQSIGREKPSLKAISTCLNLLIESNQFDLTQDFLLNSNRSLSLNPNTCIFNIFVKYHCKKGDIESAFEVVKEMKKSKISYPNLITYSTVMDGLCKNGRFEEAIQLFEEMVGKNQILPDSQTYDVLINGFCCRGKVDRTRKIMDFMKNNGCTLNVFNYSALMNGFSKEGRWQEAKDFFDEMKSIGLKPDTITYTTLIGCFCKAGKTLLRRKVSGGSSDGQETADDGVYLNKASYRVVLNSLCSRNDLNKATELLDLMLSRGFIPHHSTSDELLMGLCKAGMVDDALAALGGLAEMPNRLKS